MEFSFVNRISSLFLHFPYASLTGSPSFCVLRIHWETQTVQRNLPVFQFHWHTGHIPLHYQKPAEFLQFLAVHFSAISDRLFQKIYSEEETCFSGESNDRWPSATDPREKDIFQPAPLLPWHSRVLLLPDHIIRNHSPNHPFLISR